jgi:hypothetical protein
MHKTLTICDLCEKNQAGLEVNVLELRTEWAQIHVCPGCLGRPISLLVSRMADLEKRGLAQLEKERAERDAQREVNYTGLGQQKDLGMIAKRDAPLLRLR